MSIISLQRKNPISGIFRVLHYLSNVIWFLDLFDPIFDTYIYLPKPYYKIPKETYLNGKEVRLVVPIIMAVLNIWWAMPSPHWPRCHMSGADLEGDAPHSLLYLVQKMAPLTVRSDISYCWCSRFNIFGNRTCLCTAQIIPSIHFILA